MLPYFGVFDITYKVDGYNVTLMGQVTRPTLKSDAENVVLHLILASRERFSPNNPNRINGLLTFEIDRDHCGCSASSSAVNGFVR